MRFVKPPYLRCPIRFAENFQARGSCVFLSVGKTKNPKVHWWKCSVHTFAAGNERHKGLIVC